MKKHRKTRNALLSIVLIVTILAPAALTIAGCTSDSKDVWKEYSEDKENNCLYAKLGEDAVQKNGSTVTVTIGLSESLGITFDKKITTSDVIFDNCSDVTVTAVQCPDDYTLTITAEEKTDYGEYYVVVSKERNSAKQFINFYWFLRPTTASYSIVSSVETVGYHDSSFDVVLTAQNFTFDENISTSDIYFGGVFKDKTVSSLTRVDDKTIKLSVDGKNIVDRCDLGNTGFIYVDGTEQYSLSGQEDLSVEIGVEIPSIDVVNYEIGEGIITYYVETSYCEFLPTFDFAGVDAIIAYDTGTRALSKEEETMFDAFGANGIDEENSAVTSSTTAKIVVDLQEYSVAELKDILDYSYFKFSTANTSVKDDAADLYFSSSMAINDPSIEVEYVSVSESKTNAGYYAVNMRINVLNGTFGSDTALTTAYFEGESGVKVLKKTKTYMDVCLVAKAEEGTDGDIDIKGSLVISDVINDWKEKISATAYVNLCTNNVYVSEIENFGAAASAATAVNVVFNAPGKAVLLASDESGVVEELLEVATDPSAWEKVKTFFSDVALPTVEGKLDSLNSFIKENIGYGEIVKSLLSFAAKKAAEATEDETIINLVYDLTSDMSYRLEKIQKTLDEINQKVDNLQKSIDKMAETQEIRSYLESLKKYLLVLNDLNYLTSGSSALASTWNKILAKEAECSTKDALKEMRETAEYKKLISDFNFLIQTNNIERELNKLFNYITGDSMIEAIQSISTTLTNYIPYIYNWNYEAFALRESIWMKTISTISLSSKMLLYYYKLNDHTSSIYVLSEKTNSVIKFFYSDDDSSYPTGILADLDREQFICEKGVVKSYINNKFYSTTLKRFSTEGTDQRALADNYYTTPKYINGCPTDGAFTEKEFLKMEARAKTMGYVGILDELQKGNIFKAENGTFTNSSSKHFIEPTSHTSSGVEKLSDAEKANIRAKVGFFVCSVALKDRFRAPKYTPFWPEKEYLANVMYSGGETEDVYLKNTRIAYLEWHGRGLKAYHSTHNSDTVYAFILAWEQ